MKKKKKKIKKKKIKKKKKKKKKKTFTAPTYNNSQPIKRCPIFPQGMLNIPTLCQCFMSKPLEIICRQFPKSVIYHYMDNILLSDSNIDTLERMFEKVKLVLPKWGLQIAPEKIQRGDSVNYRLHNRFTEN